MFAPGPAPHGYDFSKLIQLRSSGALRFHFTSLYPLLHRLEKLGWESKAAGFEKAEQRRRRYYTLTPQGRIRRFAICSPYRSAVTNSKVIINSDDCTVAPGWP
jgi:DNA-binding PadR family transcriptional regulator